jgi:hypothetical protein
VNGPVLLLIAVIWGIAAAQAIEAYPTLVAIERVILVATTGVTFLLDPSSVP